MKKLDTFCDDLKQLYNGMIDNFKEKIASNIDENCKKIPNVRSSLKRIHPDIRSFEEDGSKMSMSELVKVYEEVANVDDDIGSINCHLKIPRIDKSTEHDTEVVKKSFEMATKFFWDSPLASNIFRRGFLHSVYNSEIPSFLQTLRQAVLENDLNTVKRIMENPKLPPNSIPYILNYRYEAKEPKPKDVRYFEPFPKRKKSEEEKLTCSLLLLAALNEREDIVRYLLSFKGYDFFETYKGDNVVHLLLHTLHQKTENTEKIIEQVLELEPKLVGTIGSTEWSSMSFFDSVIWGDSTYLCRLLVEKYGIDVNALIDEGLTPLIAAFRYTSWEVYEELVELGASPLVKASNGWSLLHEACEADCAVTVEELVTKYPEMLKFKNSQRECPLTIAFREEALEVVKTIYGVCRRLRFKKHIPKGFKTKKQIFGWNISCTINEIGEWIESAKI